MKEGLHDIELAPSLYCKFVVPAKNEITDIWLDSYHYDLLHSAKHADRLLGLASVVYWGYFTFGGAYARNKVDWHVNGNRSKLPTTPDLAFSKTEDAIGHLSNRNLGEAMAALGDLSQLGQTPFASKVVAFMSPSIAGVYDNRIAKGLSSEGWATSLAQGIGQTKSPKVKTCYQSWCTYLSQIASQLNLGISYGKKWEWCCGSDKGNQWRALDVERALFSIYGKGTGGA